MAVLAACVMPVAAEDAEPEAERDLRPVRDRHPLEAEYASGRWNLEFDYDAPERVTVERRDGTREVVTYMTFSVRNPTTRRVPLRVSFSMTTDHVTGPKDERVTATYTDGADAEAEAAVEARLGALECTATEMRGLKREGTVAEGGKPDEIKVKLSYIEPGELRRGIAIFGVVTDHADRMVIDVRGLWDPINHRRTEVVAEDKILRITYERPGDAFERQKDVLANKGEEWVVLSSRKVRDRAR